MGLDRRAFLTFAAGGVVGLGLTPVAYKITDDAAIWSQNWRWTPTVPKRSEYFAKLASKLDNGGAGVRVVFYDGKPCQVVGDPGHPLSRGGLSAMAENEVAALYSENRVQQPMIRRGEALVPCTWSEALATLKERLEASGQNLAVVSGDETGAASEVLAAFAAKAGGKFFMMPGEAASAAGAMRMLGAEGQLGFDLERSDYVLILGADALESWGASVRNARAFSDAHPTGREPLAKYVYAGPVLNSTGVVADEYLQARPGAAGALAMGLARKLMEAGATAPAKDFAEFKRLARSDFGAARVEAESGLSDRALTRIARELAAAKRPLVIAGSEFGAGAGARTVAAALAVNLLLGNLNQPGGVRAIAEAPLVVSGAPSRQAMFAGDLVGYLTKVAAGQEHPGVLMVYDANPAYALPRPGLMAQAVKQAGFTVSFSPFLDETAKLADLILPGTTTLERHDDVYTPYGAGQAVYSVNQPLVKQPLCDAKNPVDVVLALAKDLGINLGVGSAREAIEKKADALGASFATLAKGQAWTREVLAQAADLRLAPVADGMVSAGQKGFSLALAPQARTVLGSGGVAPLSGLNAVRDSELAEGLSVVRMSAATARNLGLREGAGVELAGPDGKMEARVQFSEKVMPGVAATSLGLGRTGWNLALAGDNAHKLMSVADEPDTGLSVWTGSRVNVA